MSRPIWKTIAQYIESAYDQASRPDTRTVLAQIKRGEIIGEKRGGRHWVLVDADTGLEMRQSQLQGQVSAAGVKPVNDVAARILQQAVGG